MSSIFGYKFIVDLAKNIKNSQQLLIILVAFPSSD